MWVREVCIAFYPDSCVKLASVFAEENNSFFMVYIKSHSGIIKSASLKNGEVRKFNNGVMIPIVKKGSYSALGFDYKNRTVFYSDTGKFRIYYKNMNKSESTVFLDKDIGHVTSLAVDWIGRNLYWVIVLSQSQSLLLVVWFKHV